MTQSFRQSLSTLSSLENLDASTDEVFRLMLGVECQPIGENAAVTSAEQPVVTAVVGLGGMLSGACVFRCGAAGAIRMAGRMTGAEIFSVDDTVKDGIGEICNMLAGAWKGRVPGLAASCGLSLPAVITGGDYRIRVQASEFQLHRNYSFEDAVFSVTIVCDGLQ